MVWYSVYLNCPRCGKMHEVSGTPWRGLQIKDSRDREGTIAQLYAGRLLPDVSVRLLNDAVWCVRRALIPNAGHLP